MCKKRVAVVGDRDSVYGYAALGIEVFPVCDAEKAKEITKKLINEDTAIIFITEAIANEIYSELSLAVDDKMTAIVPIPGLIGNTGIGMKNVRLSVEKAVGSDILFGGA